MEMRAAKERADMTQAAADEKLLALEDQRRFQVGCSLSILS